MKKTILFILSLPLLLCGCEKNGSISPNELIGTWHGILKDAEKYHDDKYNVTITFTEDVMITSYCSAAMIFPAGCSDYKLDGDILYSWGNTANCDSLKHTAFNVDSRANFEYDIVYDGEILTLSGNHTWHAIWQEFVFTKH